MRALVKIIVGIARTILAIIIAYTAYHIAVMLPIWCWGWIAEPINLTNISILKIIAIIVIISIVLSAIYPWILALTALPGTIIHHIAAKPLWTKLTASTILSLSLLALIILYIIAYKSGCVRISDGTTSEAAQLPIGYTIYASICTLIAIIGMPVTILSLDPKH